MDDLTLNERVKLIEEFERNTPHSLKAAAKKATVVLGLAVAVLGLMTVGGVTAVSRLRQEQATLRRGIADLNRQKAQALAEMESAKRTRDEIVADTERAREKLLAAQRPTASAAQRETALAAAADDLTSAYIVGRSAQIGSASSRTPRAELIAQLYSRDANERLRAYGALVETSRRDTTIVPELLRFAADPKAGSDRANGIYNTLVLLSHLDADTLVPHADEVRRFANQTRSLGPRTEARADRLTGRLPPTR